MIIDILMATYNGEKYLRKQLESIFQQTLKNFFLIISDDNSEDETLNILEEFKKKYPEKIKIINNRKNVGHCYNFLNLIKESKNDYVMFCDQDDIWEVDKIEKTLEFMREKERENEGAILVHTDQYVISKDEKVINTSSTKYFAKIINFKNFEELSFRGGLHGCTMMLNKELIDILKSKQIWNKKGLMYHDWSIAMIAYLEGKIFYLDECLMKYRIHSNNASIKKKNILENFISTKNRIKNRHKIFNQYYTILNLFTNQKLIKFTELNYFKRLKLNLKIGDWKYEKNYIKKIIKIIEI